MLQLLVQKTASIKSAHNALVVATQHGKADAVHIIKEFVNDPITFSTTFVRA